MHFLYLISSYTKWHYTEGFKDLSRNWKSFILFILHFFSLGFLFRTWLAPFGRLNEEYKKGFNAEVLFETLVVNTLMRIVGFVLRTIVIAACLLVLFLAIVFAPVALVLWVFMPFIILFLLALGTVNLFL